MKDLKKEVEELRLLLRSAFPVIVVETAEEQRFLDIAENLANLTTRRSSPGAPYGGSRAIAPALPSP